ncbi:MAG: hypothetical protein M1825_004396 [Sarcosagium campestre]|nr:MAG: hypothetical protein M1825_004396 [Sarcosagium campestre]
MDPIGKRILRDLSRNGWFEYQKNTGIEIWATKDGDILEPVRKDLHRLDNRGKLSHEALYDWLDQTGEYIRPAAAEGSEGLRLLVQRAKIREPETKKIRKIPWQNRDVFMRVKEQLALPDSYIQLMNQLSGVAEATLSKDGDGQPKLHFIAQNTKYEYDSWSLAISYCPTSRMTTGFFRFDCPENVAEEDTILGLLLDYKHMAMNPMLLPVVIFHELINSSTKHYIKLNLAISNVEGLLGSGTREFQFRNHQIKDDQESSEPETLSEADYHKCMSKAVNDCSKQQASRDGRRLFRAQLSKTIRSAMSLLDSKEIKTHWTKEGKDRLNKPRAETFRGRAELLEWIGFNEKIFQSHEGRDVNFSARIKTQQNLLYNLILQRDNRSVAEIAEASREDSTDMWIVAVLGSMFLPSNWLATVFGMNALDFMKGDYVRYTIAYSVSSFILTVSVLLLGSLYRGWRKSSTKGHGKTGAKGYGLGIGNLAPKN